MSKLLRFSDLKARRIAENWPRVRRLIEDFGFPSGYYLSPQVRVWDEAEIEAWLESRRTDHRAISSRQASISEAV